MQNNQENKILNDKILEISNNYETLEKNLKEMHNEAQEVKEWEKQNLETLYKLQTFYENQMHTLLDGMSVLGEKNKILNDVNIQKLLDRMEILQTQITQKEKEKPQQNTDKNYNRNEDFGELYLTEADISKLCNQYGIQNPYFCKGIDGIATQYSNFTKSNEKNAAIFVNVNQNHWLVVNLHREDNNNITYQVADSAGEVEKVLTTSKITNPSESLIRDIAVQNTIPSEEKKGVAQRENDIDIILQNKATKKPFTASKQENPYDCGIYAVLHAKGMQKGSNKGYFEETKSQGIIDKITSVFNNKEKPQEYVDNARTFGLNGRKTQTQLEALQERNTKRDSGKNVR